MRTIEGIVVSAAMKKTVVVAVTRTKEHTKYRKTYTVTKRFKAHDEAGVCAPGDRVRLMHVRPMSREKRWKVVEKIENGKGNMKNDSEKFQSDDDVNNSPAGTP